ncbi:MULTISPECIES: HK97-gp10 family putative phage morphogenesis protein [Bacillus]|uniref:HK97-gp10 family putative phage morphogenesis protein n=1 Tax=Bacillus TaxID=1386 RepID=UPI00208DA76D|nr:MULTISPECIES: HK97-gp10 family putative phage morphogenesis protein [Bacillus]
MELDGFDELEKYFRQIGNDVQKAEKVALKAGGEIVADEQRRGVNVSDKQQPHIKDNITVSSPQETKDSEIFVSVGPNKKVAYRARFLEYGTSKMSPHPFIEKSVDTAEGKATDVMERIITGAIK